MTTYCRIESITSGSMSLVNRSQLYRASEDRHSTFVKACLSPSLEWQKIDKPAAYQFNGWDKVSLEVLRDVLTSSWWPSSRLALYFILYSCNRQILPRERRDILWWKTSFHVILICGCRVELYPILLSDGYLPTFLLICLSREPGTSLFPHTSFIGSIYGF